MQSLRPRAALALAFTALLAVATSNPTALGASAPRASSAPPSPVVPAALRERFAPEVLAAVEAGQPARVIVRFRHRANLQRAAQRGARVARIGGVQRALAATAQASQGRARARLTAAGLAAEELWIVNALAVTAPAEVLRDLAGLPEVEQIVPDSRVQVGLPPLVRGARGTPEPGPQPHLLQIRADQAWRRYGVRGEGVVVGVLDTGVSWEHPALKTKYRGWDGHQATHAGNWHDVVEEAEDYDDTAPHDAEGHGTHVTGLIVAEDGPYQIGVAPGARWIACRAFAFEEAELSDIVACLQWLLAPTDASGTPRPDLAPHIVNNSWGIFEEFPVMHDAVDAMTSAGILMVAAAGNFGPFCASITMPAAYPNVLAVGALAEDSWNIIAFFSGRGPAPGSFRFRGFAPDVVAPGEFIWSTFEDDEYIQMIGTSQATPQASGLAALVWSARPDLIGQTEQTMDLIKRSTLKIPNPERECDTPMVYPNNVFGWGMIDAEAAVGRALGHRQPPSRR